MISTKKIKRSQKTKRKMERRKTTIKRKMGRIRMKMS
jgi:hypothetical protein